MTTEEAVPRPTAQSPLRVSLLVGLLFGLASMGSSSAAVAVPSVSEHFGVSLGTATWTITLYVLLLAVTTAVYGRVSDMVGVRAPLVLGVGLMTLGALAAALAPTFEALLVARVLQGAGAAAVPTLAATILSARYEGEVRGLALGRMAALSAALNCAGPLLGGAAEAAYGWRAVMALPIVGVLVLPFIWQTLAGAGSGARLDVWGAILVGFAAAGLVLVVQSPANGLGFTVAGVVTLLLGVPLVARRVRNHPHGFLPWSVIRNGTVVRSALAAAPIPACWFALLIAVPAVLVENGWSAWEVGLLLLPSAAAALVVPRWSAGLLHRYGGIRLMVATMFIASAATLISGVGLVQEWPVPIAVGFIVMVVAFGLGHPAVLSTVGESTDLDVRGVALGIVTLVFLVGGSVGSAMVAGLGELIGIPETILVAAALPALAVGVLVPELRRVRGLDAA